NSVRYDIKQLQDKIERLVTYNLQPLMAIADKLGLPWEQGLIDEIWRLLARSQTHSVCTNTDKTNARIFERLKMSYELAESTHAYLLRKLAKSCAITTGRTPLIVSNTLPETSNIIGIYRVFTSLANFSLWFDGTEIAYTLVNQSRDYGGTWRKDESLHDDEKYYYFSEIEVSILLPAFGYKVLEVDDTLSPTVKTEKVTSEAATIQNAFYQLTLQDGKINLIDRQLDKVFNDILSFENDGDAGDNYDHCPPEQDWTLPLSFATAQVSVSQHLHSHILHVKGEWLVPADLNQRAQHKADQSLPFSLELSLQEGSDVIGIKVNIVNKSLNHRLRMLVNAQIASRFSRAGTQFFEIERDTQPVELKDWREKGFVEEPTTTEPLLNYVSLVGEQYYTSIFSHGCKEYQVKGDRYDRLAVTLFRACAYFGLPDLSRRPGRASGLSEKLIETPDSQLLKSLSFDLALHIGAVYQANQIRQRYVNFAKLNAYYHEQILSRTGEFDIHFFHTNPLDFTVPNQFSLGALEGFEGVFSTLIKHSAEGYLLRVYNSDTREIHLGQFSSPHHLAITATTNMLGEKTATGQLSTLSSGLISTYLVV
ncbi:MAG: glycoside hydrolase family 38 C-terminal domain-containing protein, partial [Kluyvera sp.]